MSAFRLRRAWLAKAIAGGAAGGLASGAMGLAVALRGFGDFGPARRVIFAGLFLAFCLLLLAAAATYLAELIGGRPIVRMGPAGLEDRRVSAQPIAWGGIRGVLPVHKGMQLVLVLDVADPGLVAPPRNPLWRLARWSARRLCSPELVVRVTGLDADLFAVTAAIDAGRADARTAPASASAGRS